MSKRYTLLQEIDGTTDAAGDLTIYANRFQPDKVCCIQLIALLNADTAGSTCKIGLVKGAATRYLETVTLTTAGMVYSFHHSVWFPSDWQLFLTWAGGGNTKRVRAWVYGYLMNP